MRKKISLVLGLFALCLPFLSYAAAEDEIYQVIPFVWDSESQTLSALGLGSGTSVNGVGLVTNRHVIQHPTTKKNADLILLCRGSIRRSRTAECTVEGAVTAVHETLDVALVQPLDGKKLLPASTGEFLKQSINASVRLYGFPYSNTSGDDFGDEQTFKALGVGEKKPDIDFEGLGDRITVTRGNIINLYVDSLGQKAYYGTDAKGDFGISGGGAFTSSGKYIGIPTFKDSENRIIVLAYSEIYEWLDEKKDIKPEVAQEVLDFYHTNVRKGRSSSLGRMQRKRQMMSITPSRRSISRKRSTPSASRLRKRKGVRRRHSSPASRLGRRTRIRSRKTETREETTTESTPKEKLSLRERLQKLRARRRQ